MVLQVSGEQLDDFSGSVRPLLDTPVLRRLSGLFNQGQSLLHRGLSCSSPQPLQVLQQHEELVIWNLRFMNESHCHDLFHMKVEKESQFMFKTASYLFKVKDVLQQPRLSCLLELPLCAVFSPAAKTSASCGWWLVKEMLKKMSTVALYTWHKSTYFFFYIVILLHVALFCTSAGLTRWGNQRLAGLLLLQKLSLSPSLHPLLASSSPFSESFSSSSPGPASHQGLSPLPLAHVPFLDDIMDLKPVTAKINKRSESNLSFQILIFVST